MSRGKVLLLGLLAHVPALVLLYFFGFVAFVLATYPRQDPPEPLPVLGLVEMLVFLATFLVLIGLALYFPTLPVVKPDERGELRARLLASGIFTLPWFWYTRLWRTRRERKGRAATAPRPDR